MDPISTDRPMAAAQPPANWGTTENRSTDPNAHAVSIPWDTQETILGIHSNASGNNEGTAMTAGHAWLSVTNAATGKTDYIGLWPDDHELITGAHLDNGDASDVRFNVESGPGAFQRYYDLTPQQEQRLDDYLGTHAEWRITNNCASWASEGVWQVVGEDVNPDDWLGIETPREVGRSIEVLNAKGQHEQTDGQLPGIAHGGSMHMTQPAWSGGAAQAP